MNSVYYDKMPVNIYQTNQALGEAAAADLVKILQTAIADKGKAAIILATGNSQLSFFKALRMSYGIVWDRVSVFHMDEYLDMNETHPASFRRYMREKLTDIVHPAMFFGMEGDTDNVEEELARYTNLLEEHQPVACVLGIGENGHLAFNDPPADFETEKTIHIVKLAETARQQQVGEGHFATLDDVPEKAMSLTIPALLKPQYVLAVVPELRKAPAVKASLEGPVTSDCPASILRTLRHVKLYLDSESASQLKS